MHKIIVGLLAVGVVSFGLGDWKSLAADETPTVSPTPPADAPPLTNGPAPASSGGAAPAAGGEAAGSPMLGPATPPAELVASTPKGELKNPYNDNIDAIAEEGHHRYLSAGCNGCHGGGGGGGMCPPLTNDTWVYGAGDDTLFRLVTLGSDGLQKDGYTRVKHEVVVGPMPPFGNIIKTSDDLWRIIAFIRSANPSSLKHAGDPYKPAE